MVYGISPIIYAFKTQWINYISYALLKYMLNTYKRTLKNTQANLNPEYYI